MASVGKALPHESAVGHVTGQAHYIDDMLRQQNELIVEFFGSPVAHGKIKNLNIKEAEMIKGVAAIFTSKDINGQNAFGPIFHDELFLAEEKVHFLHEPIAVIAAENRHALRLAKKAIQLDIEELEPIFTIEKALEKKDFIGPERVISRGSIKQGFENSEHIIEGSFISGGQEQFYLESQAAFALPQEDNQLLVYTSTQNPTEIQKVVAEVLGLGHKDVVAICKRMGGGFGGKETQGCHPALAAGLVALKTKRPARCLYDKDTDMKVTGKRHPYRSFYKVGFNKQGVIKSLDISFFSNGGAAADLSTSVLERTMLHTDNAYYLENVEIKARICRTNLPPNTAFRGFGGPQGIAAIENIIDEIAIYLKKDSFDIRTANVYGHNERNITPYGQLVKANVLPEIFEQLAETSNYKQRRENIARFNAESKTHLRGIAMTAVKFGISFTTKHLNQGNALVNIYTDGTIQVSTGGTEMGQGLNTKIQQIVADEFDIDFDKVRIMATSTEKNNNASPTAASAGTDLNGNAAVNACREIRDNIAEFASRYFADNDKGLIAAREHIRFAENMVFDDRAPENKVAFAKMVDLAYRDRVSLGARGFYRTPGVDFNRDTGKGNPFFYFTNGATVAEVLIDRLTGQLSILRVDALLDFGKSINPGIDRGQATGGISQGLGWVTTEELRYAGNGELLSYSPTTYKIPNIQDTPAIFNLDFFENNKHKINVRASKAVAEPPLCLGLAAFSAVKHALGFVSRGAIPVLNLPATSEEILKRLAHYSKESTTPLPVRRSEPEVTLVS